MFTDFRVFGNFLICFRKFDWKSDTRHSFLEFVAKSGQNFIKNSQKNAKFDADNEKIGNSIFNREKMMTIFGWNFEIEERCKGVHCVDLGESFPTSMYLQKSASIQPRTSPSKFGEKFNSIFICRLIQDPHEDTEPDAAIRERGLLPVRIRRVRREARRQHGAGQQV